MVSSNCGGIFRDNSIRTPSLYDHFEQNLGLTNAHFDREDNGHPLNKIV